MDSQHIKRGFTDAPGARIYYEVLGEGEPLVFVHGGFIDRRMWDDQFQFFAQNYQVIRFDVPDPFSNFASRAMAREKLRKKKMGRAFYAVHLPLKTS